MYILGVYILSELYNKSVIIRRTHFSHVCGRVIRCANDERFVNNKQFNNGCANGLTGNDMKTTNCKQVIEQVQAYLLSWANDNAPEYDMPNATSEEAFVGILSQYMNDYGKGISPYALSWATPAGVLRHFIEGAMMDVTYCDVNKRLESWGLDPQRYDDDTNWNTYTRLVCRDGQRLYNKLTKGQKQ